LVDALAVAKDEDDDLVAIEVTDLSRPEAAEYAP
jgi:hypothetical protein